MERILTDLPALMISSYQQNRDSHGADSFDSLPQLKYLSEFNRLFTTLNVSRTVISKVKRVRWSTFVPLIRQNQAQKFDLNVKNLTKKADFQPILPETT